MKIERNEKYLVQIQGAGGKVTPVRTDAYTNQTTFKPEDYSLDSAKAFYRYNEMILAINSGLERIEDVKSEGNELSFVVTYSQPDALYVYDETNVLVDDSALKKLLVKALTKTYKSIIVDYYDATVVPHKGTVAIPAGVVSKAVDVEGLTLSEGQITITKM